MPKGIKGTAGMPCKENGCEGIVYGYGWCKRHWRSWSLYGDPHAAKSQLRLPGGPDERFWGRVDKNGPIPEYAPELGPCWLWTGSINKDTGYGTWEHPQFGRADRNAHRIAYKLSIGPIPDGLVIDHLCRVRLCVNPSHLEPVTQAENLRRSPFVGKTHCAHGHEWTPENTYIDPKGHRYCRACGRIRAHEKRQRVRTVP